MFKLGLCGTSFARHCCPGQKMQRHSYLCCATGTNVGIYVRQGQKKDIILYSSRSRKGYQGHHELSSEKTPHRSCHVLSHKLPHLGSQPEDHHAAIVELRGQLLVCACISQQASYGELPPLHPASGGIAQAIECCQTSIARTRL